MLSVIFNFLFTHTYVILNHFLLNILIFEAKSVINATQGVQDALTVFVSDSNILILVISK